MKKYVFLIVIFIAAFCQFPVKSQSIKINESVDSINNLLKENPYFDSFFEISYNYSIEITTDNYFIVRVDFDGPYKILYKVRISDLNFDLSEGPRRENARSICWKCKPADNEAASNCVYTEFIYTEGETEISYTDNICVQFTGDSSISTKLNSALNSLLKSIPVSSLKE